MILVMVVYQLLKRDYLVSRRPVAAFVLSSIPLVLLLLLVMTASEAPGSDGALAVIGVPLFLASLVSTLGILLYLIRNRHSSDQMISLLGYVYLSLGLAVVSLFSVSLVVSQGWDRGEMARLRLPDRDQSPSLQMPQGIPTTPPLPYQK